MIKANMLSKVRVIVSEGEDLAGEPIIVEGEVEVSGLLAHGSTGTDFGVDRDVISVQSTFITFEDFPEKAKYVVADGVKYSISGLPQRWVAPPNFRLKAGTIINLRRDFNG